MAAPPAPDELPAKKTPATPRPARGHQAAAPARTAWGDPDLSGVYTNNDEAGIPFERPAEFEGRRLQDITPSELAAIVRRRQQETLERTPAFSEFPGATSPLHWFEHYNAANSRAWLVSDPPDGHVPPLTVEAEARAAARTAMRRSHGPADSWEDRSLYDRCITRGIPGSMMPAIYGNAYQIHQGPGVVAIRYEMIHETRVIPLDGRPHVSPDVRLFLGDPRGRWEGNTLVVETTNFTRRTPYRGSTDSLRLVERFTPVSPDVLEWAVTLDDPHTWTRPWTFAMNLSRRDRTQQPFEYACHEGNLGMRNMLSAARIAEKASDGNGASR